jgi:hypothetical protein
VTRNRSNRDHKAERAKRKKAKKAKSDAGKKERSEVVRKWLGK